MRALALGCSIALYFGGVRSVSAQTPGQAFAPAAEPTVTDTPFNPSAPRRTAKGFQGSFRSGMIIPWGDVTDAPGDALGARSSWQVPLFVDAGLKVLKPLWLGVYAGIGFGVAASDEQIDTVCSRGDVSCSVFSLQLGLQAQYQFGASETYNPWVAYGAGYEYLRQSLSVGSYQESTSASGITYARVGAGLDYRGVVGFGPFVEATAGQFAGSTTEMDDEKVYDAPIDDDAWHGWLMFGLRVVMFP